MQQKGHAKSLELIDRGWRFGGTAVALRVLVVNLKATRRVGLVLSIPLLVVCVPLASHNLERFANTPPSSFAPQGPVAGPLETFAPRLRPPQQEEIGRPEPTDLYGNEITVAVATYQWDSTGTLYEVHAPQIELPQLRPPKS